MVQQLSQSTRALFAAMALAFATTAIAVPAAKAGDNSGNFMVRVLGAGVLTQDNVNSLTANGTSIAPPFDAEISDEFIPAATLTYFFTNNLAVELFCCFATHQVELSGPISGEIADFWIFPPALTLQYHFDPIAGFKPYVGAGVQYIHFFDEDGGSNALGADSVSIDDAFGFTLQAGVDVELGGGWYLNADVKQTWLDTDATWRNASNVTGTPNINADVDVNPLIISAGIGYRFNLFGGGHHAPLK